MTALPTPPPPGQPPVLDLVSDLSVTDQPDEVSTPSWEIVPTADTETERVVRVMLVEELERVAAHMSELLAPDKRVRLVETISDGSLAVERIIAERPDLVIVDALLQGQLSGADVARSMRAAGADMPIIFLTVPDQPLTLNGDLGEAEVVTLPVDGHMLLTTILAAAKNHHGPAAGASAGTVAVFSAKGGVGRTAIAHNLAVAMGQANGTRTVLVDGDQVHGDLRLHLDAPEDAPSLLQLPTGHVTEADVAPLLWQDATGLDVLLAPPRMEQADLIMLADIRRAHHTLKQMFDLVVVDVPAVMDDRTLAMLDDADVVIDVTTPRRGAVRKMQRCHAVLTAAGFPMDKILTVVNHADPDYDAAEFAAELGWQPDAVLMHDERLASGAVGAGSSIVTAYPDSLFSHGFKDLAELLASRMQTSSPQLATRAA
jgi:pilus assembly protein CpaE